MAEHHEPVLHGELREMINRLDERISGLDRNMGDRISEITDTMKDMRTEMRASQTEIHTDMRQMRNWLIGLYLFILSVATGTVAFYKAFPNP